MTRPRLCVKRRCCRGIAPFPIDGCGFYRHDQAMVEQRGSIVPFAGWRRARFLGESPLRQAMRSVGDRVVRIAEEMVGQDIDARIAGIKTHPNEVGHDPFGFDPETSRYALAVAALLHRRYFRTQVYGIDRVPAGRVLIVANHSGQLPFDAVLIASALMLDAVPPRFPRSMVETWTAELPFISTLYPKLGQVVGSPENARRLLRQEECLIVFPEGARGISKTFDQRYQLTDFGLGFVRLALETKTPIVPVAVIGGEEQYPSIADIKPLARLLNMPAFPVMPQVFFGMVAPLPTKYRLYFGEPFYFEGDPDDDDAVVEEKVWLVKSTIQSMVNRGLRERKGVFI
ncbi:MAG: lysophospholipid acyltransferase family protein [Myxococcales bacterium]